MKLPNIVLVQRLVLSCSWLVSDENALWIRERLHSRYTRLLPRTLPLRAEFTCTDRSCQGVKVSLRQFATSFQPRLCNPITEQISLVEHQKRKREREKKNTACTGEVFGEKWGRNPLPEGRGEAGNLKQDWSLDSLHRLPSVNKCPQSTEGEAVADMLTFRDNSW